jgi:hypothetical protein
MEDAAYDAAVQEALKESKKKANAVKRAESRPCVLETDDDDEPTGYYILGCKMKASGERKDGTRWERSPVLYDSKLARITNTEDLKVYRGSEVRVAFSLTPYNTALGVGISSNIEGVQIIKLSSGGGMSLEEMGFQDESGGDGGDYVFVAPPAAGESATTEESGSDEVDF